MNTISLSEDGAEKLWKQLGELQRLIEETGSEMRDKFAYLQGVTEGLVKGAQEDVKFDIIYKMKQSIGHVETQVKISNEAIDRVEQMTSSIQDSPVLASEVDFNEMATNIEEGIKDATKQAMKASKRKVEAEAKIELLKAELAEKDAKIKEFRELQEKTRLSKQKRSESQKRVWQEGRRNKRAEREGEADEEATSEPVSHTPKKVCMKPAGHDAQVTPSRPSKPVSFTPPPLPRKAPAPSAKAGAGKPESSDDEEDEDEEDEDDIEDSE
jgi:hypothetical protein